jgi:peptidylprolyl isomerase
MLPLFPIPERREVMRIVQQGDQVQVHYVKHFQDGSVASSRGRVPLQVTIGTNHPRLPGLGLALVGLAAGQSTKLKVAPEQAYGLHDPGRIRRWSRTRFLVYNPLPVGDWVRLTGRRGRRHLVRVLEDHDNEVVIDANHRWAGQAMELEVEVITILEPGAGPALQDPDRQEPANAASHRRRARRPVAVPAVEGERPPGQCRAIAFDVDTASLLTLRQTFPGWQVEAITGATTDTLARDWNPEAAELLVVGARDNVAETLGLCRGLRSQLGRARTTLLVLVPSAQEALVRAALEAGADSCLVLPVHAKDLAAVVTRAQQGNQPGRHTLDLDQPQREDSWRDDGGQG